MVNLELVAQRATTLTPACGLFPEKNDVVVARDAPAAGTGDVGGVDSLGPLLWCGVLASMPVSMSPYRRDTVGSRYGFRAHIRRGVLCNVLPVIK